jgi:hypothetical protein
VILQIDVTVTGPDGVMTGSAAVTVNEPPAAETAPAGSTLETLRMQQRSQALMRGFPRA